MNATARLIKTAAILAAVAGHAMGQPCEPTWPVRCAPAQVAGGYGNSGRINSTVVFDDDGPGPHPPALFVFGSFESIGGVPTPSGIARWDGAAWAAVSSPLPAGADSSPGHGAVVLDQDGPGGQPPTMYAILSDGNVYRLDGSTWTMAAMLAYYFQVGHTFGAGGAAALFVTDPDGPGPRPQTLYAAQWNENGADWYQLYDLNPGSSSSIILPNNASIDAVAGLDTLYISIFWGYSGSGQLLRESAGSLALVSQSVSGGYKAMAVYDPDGNGPSAPSLYVGGNFAAGPGPAVQLARLVGGVLAPVTTNSGEITGLWSVDDGRPPGHWGLYATGTLALGGTKSISIARFDGASWSGLGPGIPPSSTWSWPIAIRGLAAFDDDGPGPRPMFIYAVGDFTQAGYVPARGIARWDGHYWEPPGPVLDNAVHAMAAANLGDGSALYLGGQFTSAAGLPAVGIARWDGQAFSRLGPGMNDHVDALAAFQGSLFAAGRFTAAGGVPARHVAKWNGSYWTSAGDLSSNTDALAVYDDGSGAALYAAGSRGSGTGWVSRWNGQQWTIIARMNEEVTGLQACNGSLYASGAFDYVDQLQVMGLARLDAGGWHAVAEVPAFPVTAISSQNATLFIAGPNGSGAGIHALNGQSWFALPPMTSEAGDATITALSSFDEDGPGSAAPVLYASGEFDHSGTVAAQRLARWDGREWSGAAPGLDKPALAFAPFGAGTLYAGGRFRSAGGQPSWFLAGLSGCPGLCYANCDASTAAPALSVADFVCFLNRFAAGDPYCNCDTSTVMPVLNVNDFTCFLNRFAVGCP